MRLHISGPCPKPIKKEKKIKSIFLNTGGQHPPPDSPGLLEDRGVPAYSVQVGKQQADKTHNLSAPVTGNPQMYFTGREHATWPLRQSGKV